MRHLVGLGNPGMVYAETRHNLGFRVAEALAAGAGARFVAVHPLYQVCVIRVAGEFVRLIKPMTFMNRSGVAVALAALAWGFSPRDLLAVYDDMALPVGGVRLRPKGSDGGHNGVASLIAALETSNFARLRLGIGAPVGMSVVDHVLSPFSDDELPRVEGMLSQAVEAVHYWIEHGLDKAMNRYNSSVSNPVRSTLGRTE